MVTAQLSAHSGTSKVATELVRGLRAAGCDVSTHAFSTTSDVALLGGSEDLPPPNSRRSRVTRTLSTAFQLPLIRTVWRDGFAPEDAVDFWGAITDSGFVLKARRAQLVVFMNYWAALPRFRLETTPRPRTVVYFHELPSYAEVPPGVRGFLRGLVRGLASRCDCIVSVSPRIQAGVRNELGLESQVLYHGIRSISTQWAKEGFVLLDTRWTDSRQPLFALDVAAAVPETRFVMAGHFPSPSVRAGVEREIRDRGIGDRITIRTGLTETQLTELYGRARWYLRWSAVGGEAGPSVGMFDAIAGRSVPIVDEGMGGADFLRTNQLGGLVVRRDPTEFASRLRFFQEKPEQYTRILERIELVRQANSWPAYGLRLLQLALRSG